MLRSLLALALCSVGAGVCAQTGAASDAAPAPEKTASNESPGYSLEDVTVKARSERAGSGAAAASEGIVSRDRLADRPSLRPGDVLETVPGMVVTQHSGDGKANQYFLRGYNLDHGTDFASFVEGVPVNMPTNAHGQGYSDLNFLIPELVRSIDYRKGSYFAENGDFAAAGSAHIRYLDSLEKGIADVTLGGYGYRRVLFANAVTLNPDQRKTSEGPRLLYALELQEGNGPWQTPEGLRKINGLLRLSDGSEQKGWSVNAIAYSAHWTSTDQVPLSMIQSGQLCRFCALDPTDGGTTRREILSGEWHQIDSRGYTRISAFAAHYQLQLWSNFSFYESNPATGDQFSQLENRNIVGGTAQRGWKHKLWNKDSVTEVGLQLRHDQIHVGLLDTEDRVAFQTVSDDRVGETMASVWLQNTTLWRPWFRSVLGLRSDSVWMNLVSSVNPLNNGSASGNRLEPKMSLIFGPWPKTEFFVNAGRGFHSNDARGVINKIDPTTGGPAYAVPALVNAVGKEIGMRSQVLDSWQTSVAVWSLNSASELVYEADVGSTSPNAASTRYGLEWNNHLSINKWLQMDAVLAWTHARYATANQNGELGDYIPNAVSRVAMLDLRAHRGTWSGGLVWRYIGGYPLTQDGSLQAPSAIVTNLQLRRELSRNLSLKMDLLNAFNRQYYDIAYGQDYQVSPTAPVVPNGITVHPGEPRQLRLSLQMRF